MQDTDYNLKCLMCSADAGQVVDGMFLPNTGHLTPVPNKISMLRCGHCGGSLLREAIDPVPPKLNGAEMANRMGVQVLSRPARTRIGSASRQETSEGDQAWALSNS